MKKELARSASITSLVLPALVIAIVSILGYPIKTVLVSSLAIYALSFYYNMEFFYPNNKRLLVGGVLIRWACIMVASYFGPTGLWILMGLEAAQFAYNWFIAFPYLDK